MNLLNQTKIALRVTTTAFDWEIMSLIEAAKQDLNLAGVDALTADDPLVTRAIITYCRLHFGQPDDYDRLKKSYDEQKAQMGMATMYTDWGDETDGQIN